MSDFEAVIQVVTDDGTRIRRRFEVSAADLVDDEREVLADRALEEFADEVSAALGDAKGMEAIGRLQSIKLTLDRLP